MCLAALVLTDEGVQEHFAYVSAFAKAIFFLSVGDGEKVPFKHCVGYLAHLFSKEAVLLIAAKKSKLSGSLLVAMRNTAMHKV